MELSVEPRPFLAHHQVATELNFFLYTLEKILLSYCTLIAARAPSVDLRLLEGKAIW